MRIASVLCGLSLMLSACEHPTRLAAVDTLSIDCTLWLMTVSPSSATLSVGDTLRALATINTCGTPPSFQNAPVFWRSNDPAMASVDSIAGLIHAHAPGDITIIAASTADSTIQGAMALRVTP